MKREVRLLKRAVRDLEEIQTYVERDRPGVARRLITRLFDIAESLAENPERGVRVKDERLRALGYRFIVVLPYLLFYKVGLRVVRVYRVLHGHRRYEGLL